MMAAKMSRKGVIKTAAKINKWPLPQGCLNGEIQDGYQDTDQDD